MKWKRKQVKMTKSERKYKYIYGPVFSRRLGKSLGIDLIPFKVCSYDCIYCQLGRTKTKTALRKEYVPSEEVLKEIEQKLNETSDFDFITFAGSGEPTLHSNLGNLIEQIKKLTKKKVAVLTNGSLFYLKEVQEALLNADLVIPSLDAGSKDTFLKVNRPISSITFEEMIEGLISFSEIFKGDLWLEIMLVKGFNDTFEEIKLMSQIASKIKPKKIQLNTVVRPPTEKFATALSFEELSKITQYFSIETEIIGARDNRMNIETPFLNEELAERILAICRRRPVTIEDISKGLSVKPAEVVKALTNLLNKKKIEKKFNNGKTFYRTITEK